jgi:hypothetical protein
MSEASVGAARISDVDGSFWYAQGQKEGITMSEHAAVGIDAVLNIIRTAGAETSLKSVGIYSTEHQAYYRVYSDNVNERGDVSLGAGNPLPAGWAIPMSVSSLYQSLLNLQEQHNNPALSEEYRAEYDIWPLSGALLIETAANSFRPVASAAFTEGGDLILTGEDQRGQMTGNRCETIRVHIRANTGVDSFLDVLSLRAALDAAKRARTPQNHMVCVEVNGERIHRWDRNRVVQQNRWRKTDPDEFEVVGPIRTVIVRGSAEVK